MTLITRCYIICRKDGKYMILTQDTSDAPFQIRGYKDGAITVNETIYQKSLIISANQLITDWLPQSFQELTATDWDAVIELKPELVLFGTGQQFKMPRPSMLAPLYLKKIGVESMDTGAACRTFMALLAEGRKVVAALLIQ